MTRRDRIEFWRIVRRNWTFDERSNLRAACEAWMAANHSR